MVDLHNSTNDVNSVLTDTIHPTLLFSLLDAEQILGEPAILKDSSFTNINNEMKFHKAYRARAAGDSDKQAGNVYFMYEKFTSAHEAVESYQSIFKANADHEGITVLDDPGDESYFHSDGRNFYFILVRKGNKMIRLKVNKITNTTSKQNFFNVVEKITVAL